MHILVLPSWFESIQHPTSGSFFKDQATSLAQLQHKVGIIHPRTVSIKHPHHWRPPQKKLACSIHIYTRSYFTRPMQRSYNITKRIKQFEILFNEYIKEHGTPDILHAHSCALGPSGSAGLAANNIAKKHKIPYVVTEHASAFYNKYYQNSDIPLIKDAFNNAQHLVCVSDSLVCDLQTFGVKRPISVIGNIIDVETFATAAKSNKVKKDHYTFIIIAYLRPVKQIDVAIKAFSCAYKVNPNIKLKIIGNGVQKEKLMKLTKQLSIDSKVDFLGELFRSEIATQIAESDCYVLTSSYETFSVAVHEALAAGKSIIATRCGGPEKTIRAVDEILLENNEITTITQAMLLKSYEENNQASIEKKQNYVLKYFSHKAIGEKLEYVLHQAINKFSKTD
jgi:glycosyltransferase involved in cell wall biosynthesis